MPLTGPRDNGLRRYCRGDLKTAASAVNPGIRMSPPPPDPYCQDRKARLTVRRASPLASGLGATKCPKADVAKGAIKRLRPTRSRPWLHQTFFTTPIIKHSTAHAAFRGRNNIRRARQTGGIALQMQIGFLTAVERRFGRKSRHFDRVHFTLLLVAFSVLRDQERNLLGTSGRESRSVAPALSVAV